MLVNVLFQLPLGPGSWPGLRHRHELGACARFSSARQAREPACGASPTGLQAVVLNQPHG